jgi:nucleolar GTP-binding protein
MDSLPFVPDADDLLDKAFRAGAAEAKSARGMGKSKPEKKLTGEIRRVEIIGGIICGDLDVIYKRFPSFEQMPEFQAGLLDLKLDRNRYKKSLAAAMWASDRIRNLKNKTLRKLKTRKDPSQSNEFLGRCGSFLKKIRKDLKYLRDAGRTLRNFPVLQEVPTMVVAGLPNAGKSTFVATLTGSNVKIAPYAFTTVDILVGYRTVRHTKYQIIDSPGILDRPMGQRNKTELSAFLALKYLANVVFFIVDPLNELEPQLNLSREIGGELGRRVFLAVNDKKTGVYEGFDVFDAQNPGDCERMFKKCFGLS